jgi:hypothetical protein
VAGTLTAYSYLIFVPEIIVVAALSWVPSRGRRRAAVSAVWLAGGVGACFLLATTVLKLWSGLSFTVLDRHVSAPQGYLLVASSSWSWQGIVMSLAVIGAVAAIATGRQRTLVTVLALSCLLVPFQQARIETGTSLDKHLSVGIWLAAIAAGYGIDSLLRVQVPKRFLMVCGCISIAFPAVVGAAAAQWSFQGWNNSSAVLDAFDKFGASAHGNIAVENFNSVVLRYYTSSGRNWAQWATKWVGVTFKTTVGETPSARLAAEVKQYRKSLDDGDYGTVIVSFNEPDITALTQTTFDSPVGGVKNSYNQEVVRLLADNQELGVMVTALLQDPAYRVVAVAPYGRGGSKQAAACVIWRREAVPSKTQSNQLPPPARARIDKPVRQAGAVR